MAHDLPPALAAALRPALPDLAQDIIAAIGREVPDYARPLEGPFGRALRVGVERALARFVDGIEDPAAGDGGAREIYVALGRGEMRGGRSLDALLSAYRIGARLAWERFVAAGEAAGHEPRTLYRLASAIFDYIDGISAESVEGFTEERAAAEGERQRRRRALARLLARDDVAAEEIRDLARLAAWPRPAALAALVVGDGSRRRARRRSPRLAAGRGRRSPPPRARSPSPGSPTREAPGRRAQLEAALDGVPAALGPDAWRPSAPPLSLARARAAHALVARRPRRRTARSSSPTSTCPPCSCTAATARSRPTSPRARSRRSTSCAPARAGACARRCAPGSTIPARSRAWPASCTSTRRPCATASRSCASSSASASTTPTRASSSRSRCARSRRRSSRFVRPRGVLRHFATRTSRKGVVPRRGRPRSSSEANHYDLVAVSGTNSTTVREPRAAEDDRPRPRRRSLPSLDAQLAAQRRRRSLLRRRELRGAGGSLSRPQGRQAIGAQRLGAHVAAGEQQPDEAPARRAIALGRRHVR